MERLDHGVLNIPLAKRGNIDAQLDRHNAELAKLQRRALDDRKFLYDDARSEVRAAFAKVTKQQWAALKAKHGKPVSEIRAAIKALVENQPKAALRIINEILEQHA